MTWRDAALRTAQVLSNQFPSQIARTEAWHFITRIAGTRFDAVFPQRAHAEMPLRAASAIGDSIARLAGGEPPSYILGSVPFLDVDVFVDHRVLIPRPETEILTSLTIDWLRDRRLRRPRIIDLGTGSGCIARALCGALPEAFVVCVDISRDVLDVAAKNVSVVEGNARPALVRGDWLSWLVPSASWDVIVCNPPYIARDDLSFLEPTVSQWEPHLALDGGADGQRHIRVVVEQAVDCLAPCGLLALEMMEEQLPSVVDRVTRMNGFARWRAKEDLAGRRRFLLLEKADS